MVLRGVLGVLPSIVTAQRRIRVDEFCRNLYNSVRATCRLREEGDQPMCRVLLILVSCFLFGSSVGVHSQTWIKTYGGASYDLGYSVQQTADSGYIVTGQTESFGAGLVDVWLIKTDRLGEASWTRTYGGVGVDVGCSVQQTSDSGYIIVGFTSSFGAFAYDLWLIKTDQYGDTLWTRMYGGPYDDDGRCVQQTADSGYIVTGWTGWEFGVSSADLWVLKTDRYGDTLWTRTYGGTEDDWGSSVQQTMDSGYVITGGTRSFGAGSGDVWLLKTDQLGDTLWTKTYGGIGGDKGCCVCQTSDSGYIVTGQTNPFGAFRDVWLIKTDAYGSVVWANTYGGVGYDQEGRSVQQTNDSGYIIAGRTDAFGAGSTDVWLIRTDQLGDTLWTETYGGAGREEGWSVQETSDSGYIVTGWTSSFGAGLSDVWLIKTDSGGNVGVEERKESGMQSDKLLWRVFPNPAYQLMEVSFSHPLAQGVLLSLYDKAGRKVEEFTWRSGSAALIDIGSLKPGVYFLSLRAGRRRTTRKIVVLGRVSG